MRNEIDLRFDLPFPPSKVWRALTTPELLAAWLAPNDMVPREGARFTVRPEDGPPVACEVLEIDKRRRRLRLAWAAQEEEPTTVRFEVVETATGALLRITHARAADAVAVSAKVASPPHRSAAPTACPSRGSDICASPPLDREGGARKRVGRGGNATPTVGADRTMRWAA
jgi:uncharacterized protein YndB with AHSA1/START domain